MKKLLLLTLSVLCLCGCDENIKEKETKIYNFTILCSHSQGTEKQLTYFVDDDTNIVYFEFDGIYGIGISVYYNSKGEPMTYEEFKQAHHH